jgi:hypothetical protein
VNKAINDSNIDFLILQLNSAHHIEKLQKEIERKNNVIKILSEELHVTRLGAKTYFDELVELGRI